MSGIVPGDELTERFYQRYNELTQKNTNQSLATTIAGSSNESAVNGQNFIAQRQVANGTLTTSQFYNRGSNQDLRIQAENIPSIQSVDVSSMYSGVCDGSVFKKPLPVRRFSNRSHIKRRLDLLVESVLFIEDKQTLKFMMTTIETLVHTIKNPPVQPVNPVHLIDCISNMVKEEYFAKRVPKSICGSSVASDQASNFDPYPAGSERSIRLDRPSGAAAVSDARVVLQDITQQPRYPAEFNKTCQVPPNAEQRSFARPGPSSYQRETSMQSEAASQRSGVLSGQRLLDTLTGSTFNLFNDSEIARRRDEAAARQDESQAIVIPRKRNQTVKATPRPATKAAITDKSLAVNRKSLNGHTKSSAQGSENAINHTNQNTSVLNGTVNGVSRSGRVLKPPVKFWNSKGEELSYGDIEKSLFNDSMTLRNKKTVEKKKTPPVRGKKASKSPLPDIAEDQTPEPTPSTRKPRGRPKSSGKENKVAEKKNPVKKPIDTPAVKGTLKGKTNKKKEEVLNKNTVNEVKKPAVKRKSKESNGSTSKKKKIKDSETHLVEEEDEEDIFGGASYRKPKHQKLQMALSPSAALLSAKKAAGEAQGKATPPCKVISDMMRGNVSIQSAMSAAKEAPRGNEAIKRTIKKMEKEIKKPPTQAKAKSQEKIGKSGFLVDNPMCSATLTILRGVQEPSDCSDMELELDDDDDDLV